MSSEKWQILYNEVGQVKSTEVLAIHAALMHTGEILYFGGDEHDPGRNVRGRTDRSVLRTFRLFNCKTNEITTTTSTDTDVFCCGHAFLADGRLLVAGGTETFDAKREHADNPHDHYTGLPNVFIFDPGSKRWI